MKPLIKARIRQVLVIIGIWMVVGVLMSIHETVIFDYETDSFVINVQPGNTLLDHLLFSLIAPFLGGLFGATVIVFWAMDRFQDYPYGKMLILHSVFYVVIIILIATVVGFIYSSIFLEKPFYHPQVVDRVLEFLLGLGILKVLASWYIVTLLSVFFIHINNKYGPGNLWRMIIGKYHKARTEERIFMLLDLRSSTAIAEKLGHERYFDLLRELYQIITDDILNSRGEIYQYVGDEVVITWSANKGLAQANCMQCFFAIDRRLTKSKEIFHKKYNVYPQFKAGLHVGNVTVGEIGVVKKDILFTGDVLNTTSRIMDQCNKLNERLLISESLYRRLNMSISDNYYYLSKGRIALRGKSEKMLIWAVRQDW